MRFLSISAFGMAAVLGLAAIGAGDANAVPSRGTPGVTRAAVVAGPGRVGARNMRGIRNARASVAWRSGWNRRGNWRRARGAVACRTIWVNGVRVRRCRSVW